VDLLRDAEGAHENPCDNGQERRCYDQLGESGAERGRREERHLGGRVDFQGVTRQAARIAKWAAVVIMSRGGLVMRSF
jgi:hypothetical protein